MSADVQQRSQACMRKWRHYIQKWLLQKLCVSIIYTFEKSSTLDSFFILHWISYAENKHLSLLEELAYPFEGIVLYCKEVGKEGHQQDKAISNENQTQLKQDNSFLMNTYMYIQETQNKYSFCLEFGSMCT